MAADVDADAHGNIRPTISLYYQSQSTTSLYHGASSLSKANFLAPIPAILLPRKVASKTLESNGLATGISAVETVPGKNS
jgi:hypothetical protein